MRSLFLQTKKIPTRRQRRRKQKVCGDNKVSTDPLFVSRCDWDVPYQFTLFMQTKRVYTNEIVCIYP